MASVIYSFVKCAVLGSVMVEVAEPGVTHFGGSGGLWYDAGASHAGAPRRGVDGCYPSPPPADKRRVLK